MTFAVRTRCDAAKEKGRPVARSGPIHVCGSSTLTGDDWTSAPGAYIPAESISGTAANRGRLGSDTRTDTPAKPAPQTARILLAIRSAVQLPPLRLLMGCG